MRQEELTIIVPALPPVNHLGRSPEADTVPVHCETFLYGHFMHGAHKHDGPFTPVRLTAGAKVPSDTGFSVMADLAYLGLALFSFGILVLAVFFCEQL